MPKKRRAGNPSAPISRRQLASAKSTNIPSPLGGTAAAPRLKGLKGAIVVGVAAISLLLAAVASEPMEQLLLGSAGTRAAAVAWSLCSIVVGSAATLLLLISHAELGRADSLRWSDGRFVTDILALVANAVLWAFVATFLVVLSPSDEIHILDLLGRAASLGSVVGLAAATLWGAFVYSNLFVGLSGGKKRQAFAILAVAAVAWPIIWY